MAVPLLFVAPVFYKRLKQRHQAFATGLANKGFDVTFLEPLQSPGWSLQSEPAADHLQIIRLKIPFRAASFPGLQMICARLAYSLILRKLGLVSHRTILWLAEPSLAAFSLFSWRRIVYDRCDLHGAFPGQRRQAWARYEKLLAGRADIISVSHPFLAEGFTGRCVLAPNACSEEFLTGRGGDSEIKSACSHHHDFNGKNTIRLVSSGAHYEWVDCDWLCMLSELPAVELHIAGTGRGESFNRLIGRSNVVWHGLLERPALQELLQSCNIGLIPFRDVELIKGVDPIKAYEYAASGLEIWAPDLQSLKANQMITRFVGGSESAAAALRQFIAGPVIFTGQVPMWEERLQTILDRMASLRSD